MNEEEGEIELNEHRLITKIQRTGDREAAEELIRIYYDDIHGYVRRQITDVDTVTDLTQEIFISMLKTIQYYDRKKGASFRTWLYRIATNKIIDWFRSSSYNQIQRTIQLDDIDPIDYNDFTIQYENKLILEQIEQFVGSYPADIQNIFRLHTFGSYTFSEIAIMTNHTEGTVKSKYYRLIHVLRKEFSDVNE